MGGYPLRTDLLVGNSMRETSVLLDFLEDDLTRNYIKIYRA